MNNTAVFIKKNTQEIIDKLNDIGYISCISYNNKNNDDYIIVYTSNCKESYRLTYDTFSDGHLDYDECIDDCGINCGQDESLFFELAKKYYT